MLLGNKAGRVMCIQAALKQAETTDPKLRNVYTIYAEAVTTNPASRNR